MMAGQQNTSLLLVTVTLLSLLALCRHANVTEVSSSGEDDPVESWRQRQSQMKVGRSDEARRVLPLPSLLLVSTGGGDVGKAVVEVRLCK